MNFSFANINMAVYDTLPLSFPYLKSVLPISPLSQTGKGLPNV